MPSKDQLLSGSASEEEKRSEGQSQGELMIYLDPEDYKDEFYKAKMVREKEKLAEQA